MISAIPDYDMVNLRLGIQNERYEAYLFVENLTDSLGITSAGGSGQYVSKPRTIGLDLRARF